MEFSLLRKPSPLKDSKRGFIAFKRTCEKRGKSKFMTMHDETMVFHHRKRRSLSDFQDVQTSLWAKFSLRKNGWTRTPPEKKYHVYILNMYAFIMSKKMCGVRYMFTWQPLGPLLKVKFLVGYM